MKNKEIDYLNYHLFWITAIGFMFSLLIGLWSNFNPLAVINFSGWFIALLVNWVMWKT